MDLLELIKLKNMHISRFSSENGKLGERSMLGSQVSWIQRPKGKEMRNLLAVLKQVEGIEIKGTSFDFICSPSDKTVDFNDINLLSDIIHSLTFIELKTCNQTKVTTSDFKNFFFAITENEMKSAQLLGDRYKVFLYHGITGALLETTVQEIIERASSKNWQLSVSLGAKKN